MLAHDEKRESNLMWLLRIIIFFSVAFYGWVFFIEYVTGNIHLTFLDPLEPYVDHQFLQSAYKRISGLVWILVWYKIWINSVEKYRVIPDLLRPKTSIVKGYLIGISLGAILAVGPFLFYILYGSLRIYGIHASVMTLFLDIAVVFLLSNCTSVFEELIWRGFLITRLEERWNVHVAVLFQAVIFGLVHYSHGRGFPMLWTTMLGGLLFGYLFINTRNIYSVIALHTSVHLSNLLQSPNLVYAVHDTSADKIFYLLGASNLGGFIGQLGFALLTMLLIRRYLVRQESALILGALKTSKLEV